MKRGLLLLTTAILLISSCQSDISPTEPISRTRDKTTRYYATVENGVGAGTKVYADDQLQVLWNQDDRITIFEKYTLGDEYRFEGKDGDNAGSFSLVSQGNGYVVGNSLNHIYAVYPHDGNTTISNDGVLSLTLPANQTYKENSFGIGANTMVSVTDDKRLMFRNVGGYLSFKLNGEGVSVKSITLKGNNSEKLAGKANITMPANGIPVLGMEATATEAIVLTCQNPVALNAAASDYTEFMLVLPPTVFSKGFTITVTDSSDNTHSKSTTNSLTVSRNYLQRMQVLKVTADSPALMNVEGQIESYGGEDYGW